MVIWFQMLAIHKSVEIQFLKWVKDATNEQITEQYVRQDMEEHVISVQPHAKFKQ